MAKTCPHCGSSSIDVDSERCTEVCVECGAVLGEESLENETTTAAPSFSGYDTTLEAYDWRIKQWRTTVQDSYKGYSVTKAVKALVNKLRLPKDYIPQVVAMMSSLCDGKYRFVKGLPKRNSSLIAACIVIVCRANGVLMDSKSAADAADCKFWQVSKCARLIRRSLNMDIKLCNTDDQILDNILTRFDVTDPGIKELAFSLKNFLGDTLTCVSKNRVNVLIGVAQICVECIKKSKLKNKMFEQVCRHFLCTPRQVKTCFHSIKTKLVEYGKQIPWVSQIRTTTVHFYIKEILEYYRDCEDHRNVIDVNAEIMERTAKGEAEKKQLIQDTKERIEACLNNCGKKQQLTNDDIMHKRCKIAYCKTANPQQETPLELSDKVAPEEIPSCKDHKCCPHCCIEKQSCPKYKQTGQSDFCSIALLGRMVEYLLRNGHSESSLQEGYPKSMFEEVFYPGSKREDEEVDAEDMDDEEIVKYIKTSNEVVQSHIHTLFLKEDKNSSSK